jgi:hypothetical protein
VTVAVLPVADAHFLAASFTAVVSASPEEPMRICRAAGPVDCLAGLSSKPLPHAAVARIAAHAARARTGLVRAIVIS